ncbi:MAG TPA: hypothetical protein PKC40_13990 [Saprospiraceae bacterium]|nr:hypothetical protein [Saprospiraceae bacterium]
MSFFRFICPTENLVDELRRTFNATPLNVPDAETQPLKIVAHRGKKSTLWGPLEDLFAGSAAPIDLKPVRSEAADVRINRTGSFNTDFGFKLLEGLLGGFKVDINPLKVALKDVLEISIAFENVRKKSVAITTLGNALIAKRINMQNPAIHIFTRRDQPFGMYLISSVLESNKFSIILEKKRTDLLEVEAPVLSKLSDAGLKMDENKEHKQSVTFEGKQPLTFAFSCIELALGTDGSLQFGESKLLPRQATKTMRGGNSEPAPPPEIETSLVQQGAPALLGWDTDLV